MLLKKMAMALGLASMPSMSAFAVEDSPSSSQGQGQEQERIASNSHKTVNNSDDMERDEQLIPLDPSLQKTDNDVAKLMRKQLFNRYFPKNWSWW